MILTHMVMFKFFSGASPSDAAEEADSQQTYPRLMALRLHMGL